MPQSDSHLADPFDLARFVAAQKNSFDIALSEVSNGRKVSHWMWYVFPQLRGLGSSGISFHYGISGANEARAYLKHEILGARLTTICNATIQVSGLSANDIFGTPDDMKLQSCATLFASVAADNPVFQSVLDRYFAGKFDPRTVRILNES